MVNGDHCRGRRCDCTSGSFSFVLLGRALKLVSVGDYFQVAVEECVVFLRRQVTRVNVLLSADDFQGVPNLFSIRGPMGCLRRELPRELHQSVVSTYRDVIERVFKQRRRWEE